MAEKHAGGRPRQYETVEAMQERIKAYFAKCDARIVAVVVTRKKETTVVDVPSKYETVEAMQEPF